MNMGKVFHHAMILRMLSENLTVLSDQPTSRLLFFKTLRRLTWRIARLWWEAKW